MYPPIAIRHLGVTDFETTWHAMQQFTAERTASTPDELWLTEHQPVYTPVSYTHLDVYKRQI